MYSGKAPGRSRTLSVSQPAAVAMKVLADYGEIPRFMPDVRTSTVLEQADNYAVVEQKAVAKFLMFSKRIHLVLEVHQTPGDLRFRDRCGYSFSSYEGRWTVAEVDGRTNINNELTARPAFEVRIPPETPAETRFDSHDPTADGRDRSPALVRSAGRREV
jgi:hypothetical protein